MPGGSGEVRVRVEAQPPRVPHWSEYDLAGQFYRRLNRITAVRSKILAKESGQVALVHKFRAESVLYPGQ